jgi:hypothetical protein
MNYFLYFIKKISDWILKHRIFNETEKSIIKRILTKLMDVKVFLVFKNLENKISIILKAQ